MANRWQTKAGYLWQAWVNVLKKTPPNYGALRMVLAQAQHEDHCGDDWDGYGGWGCCDLRALNTAEKDAFAAGTLTVGMWLYPDGSYGAVHRPDSIGTLRGDSDPRTGAFKVWFFAAPQGPGGPGYMLRAGVRGVVDVLADPACTPQTYAQVLYLRNCYFGGFHPTPAEKAKGWPLPRACGARPLPLSDSEQANVDQYAQTVGGNFAGIDAGLVGWAPPGEYSGAPLGEPTIAGDVTGPAAGDGGIETGQASVDEGVAADAPMMTTHDFVGRHYLAPGDVAA